MKFNVERLLSCRCNSIKENSPEHAELTNRETEILRLLSEGVDREAIAGTLHISHHTVDFYIRNIYHKLNVHSQSAAIAKAIREKII
jgi:DNA-binding NarL/FixJ family response regulator